MPPGRSRWIRIANVTGVGVIASIKDILPYVPLTGREPELASPSPVWIVTVATTCIARGPDVRGPNGVVSGDEALGMRPAVEKQRNR